MKYPIRKRIGSAMEKYLDIVSDGVAGIFMCFAAVCCFALLPLWLIGKAMSYFREDE